MSRLRSANYLLVIISILGLSAFASANEVLIATADHRADRSNAYKEICDIFYNGINSSNITDITCLNLNNKTMVDPRINVAKKSARFGFYLQAHIQNENIEVIVQNWNREDETEVLTTTHKYILDREGQWRWKLYNLGRGIGAYPTAINNFKIQTLQHGVELSKRITVDDSGEFIDQITGEQISPKKAYSLFRTEGPVQLDYLVATISIGAVFAYGLYGYYYQNDNSGDWDFQPKEKIRTNTIRFDDNQYIVNTGHAFAGMVYYQVARANGFNAYESFLFTTFVSAAWEVLAEIKEVTSINDMIVTSVGGAYIGEVFHQMAARLRTRNTLGTNIMAALLDGPSQVNRWIGKGKVVDKLETGNDKDNIEAFVGYAHNKKNLISLGLSANVYDLPGLEQGQNFKAFLPDPYAAQLKLETRRDSKGGFDSLYFLTQVAFAAYYQRRLVDVGGDDLRGYEFVISPAGGFEVEEKKYGEKEDFMANVHIIGPHVLLKAYLKNTIVTLNMDVFTDFAMVNSYALDEYKKVNPNLDGVQSVIRRHEYYYGKGTTENIDLTVSHGKFSAGGSFRSTEVESIHGADRYPETVTKDLKYSDKLSKSKIWVRYDFNTRVAAELALEQIKRSGRIEGGFAAKDSEKSVSGRMFYKF